MTVANLNIDFAVAIGAIGAGAVAAPKPASPPIPAGGATKELETVWVEGATKVYLTIKLVHFTDGTSVKRK